MKKYRNYSEEEILDMIFFAETDCSDFREWEEAIENNQREKEKYQHVQNIICRDFVLPEKARNRIAVSTFGKTHYFIPRAAGIPEKLPQRITNHAFPYITLHFRQNASTENYEVFVLGGYYEDRIQIVVEISYCEFEIDLFYLEEKALGGMWVLSKQKAESISKIVLRMK